MRRPIARDINQRKREGRTSIANWPQPIVSSWLNFTPLSLQPSIWLDAADTSTITESSGAVSQWNDKSGNSYNATQATGTNQPTTNSSKLNGLNVISFDGNDFLNSNLPASGKPFTFVALAQVNSLSAVRTLFGTFGTLDGGPQFRVTNTTGTLGLIDQNTANIGSSTGAVSTARHFVMQVTYSSVGEFAFFIDESSSGTGTVNRTFNAGLTTVIGSNRRSAEFFSGTMAELFKFDRVLTVNELAVLRRYLNRKWAIY